MNDRANMELNSALGALGDVGLAYVLVDRCPIESCPACGDQAIGALAEAA